MAAGSSTSTNDPVGGAARGPNVLILSAAGKPIFVRHGGPGDGDGGGGGEEDWSTACGVLQGLRANVLSFGLSGLERGACALGDVQSLRAGRKLIVFKHTEALTLVSVADDGADCQSEAWLRLRLEYVYSQVLFTLTDQVASIFERSPGYDLRGMMGPNVESSIRNLLDRFDPADDGEGGDDEGGTGGCGSFLVGGVECVHPVPPEIREGASKLLLRACKPRKGSRGGKGGSDGGGDLFALLVVGTRLLTIVQPSDPASQLRASDLHLVLTFVGRQPGLLTNELWFPVCLPRYDSSGFLYAYTSCLDPRGTGLSVVLISPDNGPERFESFRNAANTIRNHLGLRSVRTKVLRVFDSATSSATSHSTASAASSVHSSTSTPVHGNKHPMRRSSDSGGNLSDVGGESVASGDSERKRTHLDDAAWTMKYEEEDEEDEGEATRGIAGRIGSGKRGLFERQMSATCYLDAEPFGSAGRRGSGTADGGGPGSPPSPGGGSASYNEHPLLTAVKVALSPEQREETMASYLELASAVHFVFRCDVYVGAGQQSGGIGADEASGSVLAQCFGPSLGFPFVDAASKRRVWDTYARLSLRLRLGSSSVETTMDALDMIAEGDEKDRDGRRRGADARGIGRDCPAQRLLESPPNVHSVTYLRDDNEWLYVGLNGRFFELYATLPATVSPKAGSAYCARLVRRLMGDERILFLSNPLTWGS